MENNAHQIEPLEKRLERFQNGQPIESILSLLNSIDNFFNNEIRITPKQYQTSLLFLGIHAVALTVSEIFWGLKGESGYKKFLESFVDGDTKDKKFSSVSSKIHKWRNIVAHQWLSSSGYSIQYDYTLEAGFIEKNNLLTINPEIYCKQYLNAFSSEGKIWQFNKILTDSELIKSKKRIVDKFKQK